MGEYTALVYQTTTGRVIYDIDLVGEPAWGVTLNGASGDQWQVTVPLTDRAASTKVREWAERWFCSVAIMWDGIIVQAGPISQNPDITMEGDLPVAVINGKGFWENLNQRVLHANTWNPATAPITDVTADLLVNDSLPNIAVNIVFHATSMANRPGSALPVDYAALGPSDSNTRLYHGYETASAGQRLQELTQVNNGPDVYFQPYLTTVSGVRYVRHKMLVGSPYLAQSGNALRFDLNGSCVDIAVSADSSPLATSSFVKGAGNEAGQLYGYSTNTALPGLGWPLLDYVDSSHSSASEVATLNSWAQANIAQFGRKLEQWKPRIILDADPKVGTYIPGHFASYSVTDHAWVPDGTYTSRILGISSVGSDDEVAMVEHQIEAVGTSS